MRSISRQMLLFAMLMIVSAAVVVGLYWAWASQQWLSERRLESIEVAAVTAEGELNTYIRSLSANLLFLAYHEAVRGMVRATRAGGVDPFDGSTLAQWRVRMERNSMDILRVNPTLFQVRLIGVANGGRELVRVDRSSDGEIKVIADKQLQRKGNRDYFQESISLKDGEIYYSSIDLNVEHGKIEVPYRPTLRVATPVYDRDERLYGIVVINADVSAVLASYASALPGETQQVYLLGDKNQFQVHPDAQKLYGTDLGRPFGLYDQFPILAPEILSWQQQLGHNNGIHTFAHGEGYLTAVQTAVGGGDAAHHYLLALIDTPMIVVRQDVWNGLLPSIAITLLLALGGILPAIVLARLVTRPLTRITEAAEAMSRGVWNDDVSAALPTGRQDEIGHLSQAFTTMQQKLRLREQELIDSSERMAATVNASLNAIITIDRHGIIETVNEQARSMFGYDEGEMVGHDVTMLMPSPHREQHDQYIKRHLEHGERRVIGVGRELTAIRKDGSSFPIFLAVNRFNHHGEIMFVGTITDISDQRLLQDTIRSSTELKRILESTHELFITTDEHGVIEYANPMAETTLMRDGTNTLVGENLLTLLPELAQPPFSDRQDSDEAMHDLQLEESGLWYRISHVHHRSSLHWQMVDITSLKQQQIALEAQKRLLEQQNRELNDFAFIASHDLQEPLRKIQAFGDRIHRFYNDALDERGQDYLQRMQSAAARMSELIQALLQLSRISSRGSEFESVALGPVVDEVLVDLEEVVAERGAVVNVEALPEIEADPLQMRQLFQNLIGNALKYQDGIKTPDIMVFSREIDANYIVLIVEDNGIGIDAKYGQKVFEPFERLNSREQFEGTGMGLAICRKIVERHGGLIEVGPRSDGMQGSRFTVQLPRAQNPGSSRQKEREDGAE